MVMVLRISKSLISNAKNIFLRLNFLTELIKNFDLKIRKYLTIDMAADVEVSIPNFSDYVINRTGVIRNVRTNKIIEGTIKQSGYRVVQLRNSSEKRDFRVCRLLAELFIPNPENKPHVDHINHGDQMTDWKIFVG